MPRRLSGRISFGAEQIQRVRFFDYPFLQRTDPGERRGDFYISLRNIGLSCLRPSRFDSEPDNNRGNDCRRRFERVLFR